MSRKDYNAIADIIHTARNRYQSTADGLPAINYIELELAYYMAKASPKFNRDKFFAACASHLVSRDLIQSS